MNSIDMMRLKELVDLSKIRLKDNWKMSRDIVSGESFMKLLKNDFISKPISDWIQQQSSLQRFIFSNSSYADVMISSLNKINEDQVKKIMRICMLISSLSKDKKVPKIFIMMSPFKKQLNTSTKILTAHEVNSGCSDSKTIYVWREEEVEKVLMHELIHFHKIDFSSQELLFSKYQLQHKLININEAVCEYIACMINCFNKGSCDREVRHSLLQSAKLLNYFGFKSVNEFIGITPSTVIFNESTNAFAYYILKSYLLYEHPTLIIELLLDKDKTRILNKIKTIFKSFSDKWIQEVDTLLHSNNFDNGLQMTIE